MLPRVLKEPAVIELVAVKDLEMFNDPAKDDEPVPLPRKFPPTEA